MTKPILYSTREVSELRNISERQVQRLAKAGLLPVARVGPRGVLYFKASDARRAPLTLKAVTAV